MMTPTPDYLSPMLKLLVGEVSYKPGWRIWLEHETADDGAGGWKLMILSYTDDSIVDGAKISVRHEFLVPAASYSRDTWAAWIFERYRDVETHEAGEFFTITGLREFAPHHGDGENPYQVWHTSDYATARRRAGE